MPRHLQQRDRAAAVIAMTNRAMRYLM